MKPLTSKSILEFSLGIGVAAIVFGAIWLALEFRFAPETPRSPLSINTITTTVLPEPMTIPSFVLVDHNNHSFTEKNLHGQWTFLFFGYTYCPDVCPTTLAVLNQVDKLLREKNISAHPVFAFISVDPNRDTVARLAEYVAFFNARFLGVTGTEEQIQILTRPLGIAYRYGEDKSSNENYLVDHSASILLINPQGELQALISPPHNAEAIATDYQKIIDFMEKT